MSSASHALDGPGTMPRTIQCPQCGVVLNIPDAAAGRRLKCPKCATKFAADGGPAPGRPSSSTFGTGPGRNMASSVTLPRAPDDDFDLPTAPGSLREQFDLPLLGEDTGPPSRPSAEADPMSLLRGDDDIPSRRRPTGAEGRAQARRCPTCGGVVPRGMSLCSTCGLDLETGTRIDLTEDLGDMPVMARSQAVPIGAWLVGGLSIFASVIFAIISLVQWSKGETGYLFLLLVCGFCIFASVQFLRAKSLKLLLIALTLGVAIDVVAMIILPVYMAMSQVEVQDPNTGEAAIQSVRLDTDKLSWGIALVVSYTALMLYLNSPPARRRFH